MILMMFLMRHDSQNMILLGNIIIGHEENDKTDWRDPAKWLMATVSDENGIKLTALMTPPHNITLYATDNIIDSKAISCLIDGLKDYEIPGVITEKSLAEYFAWEYIIRKGLNLKITMSQRIYELQTVNPEIKQFGTIRLLDERDMYFSRTGLRHLMQQKVMEKQSGKGYATSCVAQLSQMALDKGFKRCVLYTDLLNSISNSIYQKIGYKAVCDSLMLKFE